MGLNMVLSECSAAGGWTAGERCVRIGLTIIHHAAAMQCNIIIVIINNIEHNANNDLLVKSIGFLCDSRNWLPNGTGGIVRPMRLRAWGP